MWLQGEFRALHIGLGAKVGGGMSLSRAGSIGVDTYVLEVECSGSALGTLESNRR